MSEPVSSKPYLNALIHAIRPFPLRLRAPFPVRLRAPFPVRLRAPGVMRGRREPIPNGSREKHLHYNALLVHTCFCPETLYS
jgi:hypothetical protein